MKDAFGSISHKLIEKTLISADLPNCFVKYIVNYYNQTEGKLRGPWGISDKFSMKKGVFQGDPLSPLLFLMCFNSIVEEMTTESQKHSYENSPSFLAYADDTSMMTNSEHEHQNLTHLFEKITKEIDLTIRPDKCISWKVEDGKILPMEVIIGLSKSKPLGKTPEKYLGALHSIDGTQYISECIFQDFQLKCRNLTNAKFLRCEDRIEIFQKYLIPAKLYCFMVQSITSEAMIKMDKLQEDFLKTNHHVGKLHKLSKLYVTMQARANIFRLYSD